MRHQGAILTFPQNRVWRTYPGGRVLDQLAGMDPPRDSHFPEDWIGSVTTARNPGREAISEGLSLVDTGRERLPLAELLAADPEYFLGAAHVRAFGARPQLLVKLLDSAVRLHFQCHPTAAFARTRMQEPSGKAEAYHILAIREDVEQPYVYIGFQRPPSKAQLKAWIETQDLAVLEAAFDRIPVRPGDTLFIPGGFPHAIGEGILLVEVMEPSDLAVRFEFEKAGYVLPEEARFMGRGLDFCLEVFDFSESPLETLRERVFFPRRRIQVYPDGAGELYALIGEETTPCLQMRESVLRAGIRREEEQFFIGIVTRGRVRLRHGTASRVVECYDKFFYPAGAKGFTMEPMDGEAVILECAPPRAPRAEGA